ncbi:MAG: hypothetical protein ABI222_00985 [Opitutaceae bacterium]
MKNKKLVLFVAMAFLFLNSQFLVAQGTETHLEPVNGYLSSYGFDQPYLVSVRNILVGRVVESSPAVMVTLPSFSEETMVYLSLKDGSTFVVSATTSKSIWSNENADKIVVIEKQKQISKDVADQIRAGFTLATAQTRYPDFAKIGLDGVTYHFSTFATGIGIRAGQTWSPDSGTVCGKLVNLGEQMHAYVRGETTAENLKKEAREILSMLKRNK